MKIEITDRVQTNRLDKEFEAMLFPLNLMQMMILQPKYRILNGCIVRNGYLYNALCFIGITVIVFIHINKLFLTILHNDVHVNTLMYRLNIFDAVFYITIISFFYIANVLESNINIELIKKMHKVYRVLDCRISVRMFRNYNWIHVLHLFGTYCLFFIAAFLQGNMTISYMLCFMSLWCFDANIIYATRTIKFLTLGLRLWRLEKEEFLAKCSETNHDQLTKYLKTVDERGKLLYRGYMDILEAFEACKKLYQKKIFLFAMEIFVHTLSSTQVFLEILDVTDYDMIKLSFGFLVILLCLWVTKNIVLISCLCAACQQFYLAITEVNMDCAVVQCEEGCLVDARRLCKKVSRVSASWNRVQRMRAGGVLEVDATLPLRILRELAIYTIVLLQFAFL